MLDESLLKMLSEIPPAAPEIRARISAKICSGPVFVKKEGQLVFNREETENAYTDMYKLFLETYTKERD